MKSTKSVAPGGKLFRLAAFKFYKAPMAGSSKRLTSKRVIGSARGKSLLRLIASVLQQQSMKEKQRLHLSKV